MKPATQATIEEMKADIKRMAAEIKADREARGLPEEAPAKFVSLAMAWTLIERCKPVQQFALKYTQLCNGANEVLPISEDHAEWLRGFIPYLELIRQSTDQWPRSFGTGLGVVITTMLADKSSEHKADVYTYVKRLYQGLELANLTTNAKHFKKPKPLDEEEFEAEYAELFKYYESIKEVL